MSELSNASLFNAAAYLVDRHVEAGDGGRVAVRCAGADTTYAELADAAARVGAGLLRLGVRREERVMLCMADSVELLSGILGAWRVGVVAVPVSTMLTGAELGGILADSRACVLVVSSEFATTGAEALARAPATTRLVVLGGATPPVRQGVTTSTWDELVDGTDPADGAVADTAEDSPALWLYTSGTTGSPKAAMHRHANVRHVCETYGAQVLGVRPDDRCLSVAKLFFAYGLGNSALFPLAAGATTILEGRRPTPDVMAERVRADRPTIFFGVPTSFAAMLAAELPEDLLFGVRIATSAGEPLPAPLQQKWSGRFGVQILDGLGSTEALHIFCSNAPGDIGEGSSGRAVPGYDLQIRDERGELVAPGTAGSLFVRGESIATGYFCRTAATRSVFQGQWLATGDTYVQDDDGRYHCLGRSGDMIKAGGIWVTPVEVEARLLEHDDVIEAAVVGVPDAAGLVKPVACVVLGPGAAASGAELVAFCREGLAHFKAPRSVLVVDTLPRTATGKLQRFKVRDLAGARAAASERGTAPVAEVVT